MSDAQVSCASRLVQVSCIQISSACVTVITLRVVKVRTTKSSGGSSDADDETGVTGRRLDKGTGRKLLHADLTAADARAQVAGLERVRLRVKELASDVDGRQPEAELVGEVVTRAASAITLDERSGTEVFQT